MFSFLLVKPKPQNSKVAFSADSFKFLQFELHGYFSFMVKTEDIFRREGARLNCMGVLEKANLNYAGLTARILSTTTVYFSPIQDLGSAHWNILQLEPTVCAASFRKKACHHECTCTWKLTSYIYSNWIQTNKKKAQRIPVTSNNSGFFFLSDSFKFCSCFWNYASVRFSFSPFLRFLQFWNYAGLLRCWAQKTLFRHAGVFVTGCFETTLNPHPCPRTIWRIFQTCFSPFSQCKRTHFETLHRIAKTCKKFLNYAATTVTDVEKSFHCEIPLHPPKQTGTVEQKPNKHENRSCHSNKIQNKVRKKKPIPPSTHQKMSHPIAET